MLIYKMNTDLICPKKSEGSVGRGHGTMKSQPCCRSEMGSLPHFGKHCWGKGIHFELGFWTSFCPEKGEPQTLEQEVIGHDGVTIHLRDLTSLQSAYQPPKEKRKRAEVWSLWLSVSLADRPLQPHIISFLLQESYSPHQLCSISFQRFSWYLRQLLVPIPSKGHFSSAHALPPPHFFLIQPAHFSTLFTPLPAAHFLRLTPNPTLMVTLLQHPTEHCQKYVTLGNKSGFYKVTKFNSTCWDSFLKS